jgi:hypothetical protein
LGAEWRATALEAEQGRRQIAVEIKSFTLTSLSTDMYMAVGQYYCYHSWLLRTAPNRVLYLAVPDSVIDAVFAHQIGRAVQEDHGPIRLIGFDPETARVTRWVE